jgi:hypothetical protein
MHVLGGPVWIKVRSVNILQCPAEFICRNSLAYTHMQAGKRTGFERKCRGNSQGNQVYESKKINK